MIIKNKNFIMALKIVFEYKSRYFSYSIRESMFKGRMLFFINVLVAYPGIHKHLAEKNSMYGAASERLAKKKIMKTLKEFCVNTSAEKPMKLLPIFVDEGYQETLFNDEM
jgi:hypothetical protein